ncbi:hypothetical protein CSR02_03790 [Acetobacter pomorum]|uniref:Uncharacterized protein n=1 Tax=Acetobacter pomorum TaxID=65959 RepID=A0A2G4RE61_9PROT|nr:hypothetical protein [Acetobacter pomorum]KDE20722.1 hypothetical protein AZ09_04585 [Acetobacter aceti 1023]PHY94852.1 hypothetical protein CSR02_03790 [Acetobacter pomorum]GBR48925.1 hypothetical protein AA11825_1169 [Acetobacter pomorum DSM 11825]
MTDAPTPTPEVDWTEEDPIDADIDARVAQVNQAAGLPPEKPTRFGPLISIGLPWLIVSIVLLTGLWMFFFPVFFH